MSSKTENMHRNSIEPTDTDDDTRYFLDPDLPVEQIQNVLRLKGMDEKEVEAKIEKVKEARHRISKVVSKFVRKIHSTYSHLDLPDIMKKGMKHAKKYGLSSAERSAFRKTIEKGDIHGMHTYNNQIKYTPMAKFLGFDFVHGQMIKIGPSDYSKLNELYALYESTKHIHANIKASTAHYKDCAPQAIDGTYDRTKHNVNNSIHPVVAALFFPNVDYINTLMLYTNIARMVLTRAQAYLRDFKFQVQGNLTTMEMGADFDLGNNIALDPNALEHFGEDTPIENIIKRYRAQIELYMTVDNLRQGRYYSVGYEANDGISGLGRILNSYEWTFFDSPDAFAVQDEGTFLRKLLAIFSIRPTYTELTSFMGGRQTLGFTTIAGMAKSVFVNIPIINIKLPIDMIGDRVISINMKDSMTQMDYFIEHKAIVPKNKAVIYSNKVAFFYANRRHPSPNFNSRMTLRYMTVPLPFINQTPINNTRINFSSQLPIGRDLFNLRSVVILQKTPIEGLDIATGCSAMIKVDGDSPSSYYGSGEQVHLHYNPSVAGIKTFESTGGGTYVADKPITFLHENTIDDANIGFNELARDMGTIFFYTKLSDRMYT